MRNMLGLTASCITSHSLDGVGLNIALVQDDLAAEPLPY
jgi:hypothetical protein